MTEHLRTTAVVIDAGEEPWSRVEPLLARRVAEVNGDGVIEVLTADEGVRAALPRWCARLGISVEHSGEPGGVTRFRLLTVPTRSLEEL
ncbi:sulfurtransferase TusA family protein [Nocardioides speluncae]|uniref:sulfurtransferase TusA family protein n=1 Tax=Nocardioides speluncae TaxID=2670337 RepID=UPI000D69653F|nr:hypothetical protein [Nocardioides speluncae]